MVRCNYIVCINVADEAIGHASMYHNRLRWRREIITRWPILFQSVPTALLELDLERPRKKKTYRTTCACLYFIIYTIVRKRRRWNPNKYVEMPKHVYNWFTSACDVIRKLQPKIINLPATDEKLKLDSACKRWTSGLWYDISSVSGIK